METTRKEYVENVKDIENLMVVRIRQDVSDLPGAALPALSNDERLRLAYGRAIVTAMEHVQADLKHAVAAEAVSLVTWDVLTDATVDLGTSAGILGSGAASSWETFGIGLVVAVVVDQIVGCVYDWIYDPHGELVTKIDSKLDEMRQLVLRGDGTHPGLEDQFERWCHQRQGLRHEAILSILNQQGGLP